MIASRCKKKIRLNRRFRRLAVGLILLALMLTGCGGTYGKFVYDEAVDQVFEDLKVLPEHDYYFSGPDSNPRAIIAIDKRYTLVSSLWKPVEMTEAQLKSWVKNPARRGHFYPYTFGRYLLDDGGERVGLWYSLRDRHAFATMKILDDKRIQVTTPADDGYRRRPFNNILSAYYDDD
jgi:hypothetical protein